MQCNTRHPRVILASTFHALPNKGTAWIRAFAELLPLLRPIYPALVVSMTPQASEVQGIASGKQVSILEYLRREGIEAEVFPGTIGDNHRNVLRTAIELTQSGNLSDCNIHYCDFDRILYWAHHHFEELRGLISRAQQVDLMFPYRRGLARHKPNETKGSAWVSHPLTQRATEYLILEVINTVYQEFLYSKGSKIPEFSSHVYFDPLGTSLVTSPEIASLLFQKSTYNGPPQTEWATIAVFEVLASSRDSRCTVDWIEVDGLGFETLELLKYDDTTSALPAAYLSAFSKIERTKEEATKRVRLALSILDNFAYVTRQYGYSEASGLGLIAICRERLDQILGALENVHSGQEVIRLLEHLHMSRVGFLTPAK